MCKQDTSVINVVPKSKMFIVSLRNTKIIKIRGNATSEDYVGIIELDTVYLNHWPRHDDYPIRLSILDMKTTRNISAIDL